MATQPRRVHLRPPGVKTGSTIGPLGPFRGTLGIQWVVGSVAVGLALLMAVSWAFLREPQPPFEKVEAFTAEEIEVGTAREAFARIYVGRASEDEFYAVVESETCPLEVTETGYLDCSGHKYGLDGVGHKTSLARLPIEVHRGAIYIPNPDE